MIEFRQATIEDGVHILNKLRENQVRTIEKLGLNAMVLLTQAVGNEYPTTTCIVNDEPAAIFGGHSETILGECRLWMLTTPLIEEYPIAFLRASRKFVDWMARVYGPVVGIVDSEFQKSFNWLRWIGFKKVHDGEFIVMRYSRGD